MATIAEIRQQYPQYKDMSDQQVADGLYKKFYSDMPRDQFDAKVGLTPAPVDQGQSALGLLKAGGSGLATGLIDLPGMGGDIETAVQVGGNALDNWVRRQIGAQPNPLKPVHTLLPTSADVEQAVGWDKAKYQPQTPLEKIVGSAAEFVPAAATMGGGLAKAAEKGAVSLIGKGASNAVKLGAVPGAASEVAGELTQGTPLEPIARAGTAIMAGGGMSKLTKGRAFVGPTVDELKATASKAYDHIRTTGQVLIDPTSYSNTVNDISKTAMAAGIDPAIHPKAWAALQRIEQTAGVAPDLAEIDTLRQVAGQAAKSIEPAERFMGGLIIGKLDHYLENLKPADVIAGDPKQAVNALVQARSMWNRARKAELIGDALEKARNQVGANYTSAGMVTALRQQLKGLANKKDFKVRFRPEERKAMLAIIRGGPLDNTLRFLSKFAIRGPVSGLTAMGIGSTISPLAGVAMAGVGEGTKFLANKLAEAKVRQFEEMIRTGAIPAKQPGSMTPALAGYYGTEPQSQ